MMIQAKFGLIWPSGFRGEDFTDGRQMMAIAHTGELKRDIDYCILANIKSHFIYIILVIIQLCKQGQRKAWRIPSPKN